MTTYRAIGKETSTVYAEGTKEDCFKLLLETYPNVNELESVYPEPIIITKSNLIKGLC